MTRDEIYDHLAQVYLGKRNKAETKKKQQFNAWLVINIVIAFIILASTFYGLSAFLTRRTESLHRSVIFALNNGPIRVAYNLNEPYPSVKSFALSIPEVSLAKYNAFNFSIRGLDEGYPGVVKIVVRNDKNETSSYFVHGVKLQWQRLSIPFSEFKKITDWTRVTDVEFVFEAWNVEKKKGIVLIDDVCFSS
ncbi:MAG: hypothetical protein A2787_06415 [Omnitrophica WOR_2 bacterium RIFCSPHIGHO2_01_FULL_48_9]|nr:MAG: hypothetical protein A3D10_07660 [Omnitrophica WOR_2 bacterium RIFCSPHIGHO2_02_FULL_48_11]OGX31289.1 MAG: hypothetical protein A2787_06415 [Omnitrophica WOR_2 bacterium RIFCSPHIGHO2_01_FULL_48_9]